MVPRRWLRGLARETVRRRRPAAPGRGAPAAPAGPAGGVLARGRSCRQAGLVARPDRRNVAHMEVRARSRSLVATALAVFALSIAGAAADAGRAARGGSVPVVALMHVGTDHNPP